MTIAFGGDYERGFCKENCPNPGRAKLMLKRTFVKADEISRFFA